LPAVYEAGMSQIGMSGKIWTIPGAGHGVGVASWSLDVFGAVERYPGGGYLWAWCVTYISVPCVYSVKRVLCLRSDELF
jgi:hypothetical protein